MLATLLTQAQPAVIGAAERIDAAIFVQGNSMMLPTGNFSPTHG